MTTCQMASGQHHDVGIAPWNSLHHCDVSFVPCHMMMSLLYLPCPYLAARRLTSMDRIQFSVDHQREMVRSPFLTNQLIDKIQTQPPCFCTTVSGDPYLHLRLTTRVRAEGWKRISLRCTMAAAWVWAMPKPAYKDSKKWGVSNTEPQQKTRCS